VGLHLSENNMSDTKQVSAALVKAQRAFGPALKDKTNPAFRSKYADLGACLDAVMDALNENGIALMQKNHPHDGGVCIETIFVHESGEQLSAGLLPVPATKQDAQGYGSAMTYARRYSVMAACGIAPEDDDGNAASNQRKPTGMAPNILKDWLLAIDQAAIDELPFILKDGLAAATEVQDREAYASIRAAGKKREAA
tara:strand:+ start:803 stop:1393 length:591 start_codon:yes stop_codon:yes gene_type:complete